MEIFRKRTGFKPSKDSLLLFSIPISHLVPLLEFNQHRKGGRDEQYCDLQEEFVVSTGPKQAPADHFGGTSADHGCAKRKHRRDHDHRHAAKAGERLLRAQNLPSSRGHGKAKNSIRVER